MATKVKRPFTLVTTSTNKAMTTLICPGCGQRALIKTPDWHKAAFVRQGGYDPNRTALTCPRKDCGRSYTARQWARRLEHEEFSRLGVARVPYIAPEPLTADEIAMYTDSM